MTSRNVLTWQNAGNAGLTLSCLVLTAYILLRPAGPIGARWARWREQQRTAKVVSDATPDRDSVGFSLSNSSATRIIFEFSDYECPFCRATHGPLMAALQGDTSLAVVYVHFPLAQHPVARGAALAQICAARQGKGSALHELLISTEAWRSDTAWSRIAAGAGVADTVAFQSCLGSDETQAALGRGLALATRLKISGTPTFVGVAGVHVGQVDDAVLRGLR